MGRGVQQHTKYDNNPILRGGGFGHSENVLCCWLLAVMLGGCYAGCIFGRAGQDARAVWHGFTVGGYLSCLR